MHHPVMGLEQVHLHTHFSTLDGYGHPEEYAKRATEINQRFLCITDHGVMGAIPRQIQTCEKHGIFPIFGCEMYVNSMQPEVKPGEDMSAYTADMSLDERKKLNKSYHLLAIAYNETGYKNLVKLTSWGWLRGFYRRPRVNHEQLLKHKEGIIFTSCCYMSEIGQAFDTGGDDAAFDMVEKYMAMFGEHFRLEMMLLDFNKQKPYNSFLIKAHDKYGLPLHIAQDCHYCFKEDSKMQRLMLMIQTKRTIKDIKKALAEDQFADLFELQDTNLWMKSEEELNEKWESNFSDTIDYEIFKQAKANTVTICEQAKGVELDRSIKLPQIEDADDKLKEAIVQGLDSRNIPKNTEYLGRIKEEYSLICEKEFSSYFLIQKMMTDEARRVCPEILGYGDGSEAVGPGRGSCCGSLICYCLGITDIDPIKHDLLFSRFLSPARGGKSMKLRFSIDPIELPEECPF